MPVAVAGIFSWIKLRVLFNLLLLQHLDAAHILGIFPIQSKSHYAFNHAIIKGLADRGHKLTVISQFQSPSLINHSEIHFEYTNQYFIDSVTADEIKYFNSIHDMLWARKQLNEKQCSAILKLNYFQKLLRSEETPVNLLIVEAYGTQCFTLLATKLNVPLVLTSAMPVTHFHDLMIGNPYHPAIIQPPITTTTSWMNFKNHLRNVYSYILVYLGHYWHFNRNIERVTREHLNIELSSLDDLHKKVSLILLNNHFSITRRPHAPNVIDVAGIHIENPKALPPVSNVKCYCKICSIKYKK